MADAILAAAEAGTVKQRATFYRERAAMATHAAEATTASTQAAEELRLKEEAIRRKALAEKQAEAERQMARARTVQREREGLLVRAIHKLVVVLVARLVGLEAP